MLFDKYFNLALSGMGFGFGCFALYDNLKRRLELMRAAKTLENNQALQVYDLIREGGKLFENSINIRKNPNGTSHYMVVVTGCLNSNETFKSKYEPGQEMITIVEGMIIIGRQDIPNRYLL